MKSMTQISIVCLLILKSYLPVAQGTGSSVSCSTCKDLIKSIDRAILLTSKKKLSVNRNSETYLNSDERIEDIHSHLCKEVIAEKDQVNTVGCKKVCHQ